MFLIFTVIVDILHILTVLVEFTLVGVAIHHLLALSVGDVSLTVLAVRHERSGLTRKTMLCVSILPFHLKLSLATGLDINHLLL
jgi:hypothetical protein